MTGDGFGAGERFQAALGKGNLKMGRPSERAVSDGLLVAWVVNPTQNRLFNGFVGA
jgi:hypothetical protein